MLEEFAAHAGGKASEGLALEPLAPNGSLAARLAQQPDRIHVVAELKHASPAEGLLLRRPAAAYVEGIRTGGASALSVVTAGGRFGGKVATLRDAHGQGLPLLMKDFITDAAQLDVAVHNGASAVLLIERLLDAPLREALVRQAHARGLDVLLEVHAGREATSALASRADLLGVNSRDLVTLKVDVPAALRLVQQVAASDGRPTLLLSGVAGPTEADLARQAGATGILVGTSLLRAAHVPTSLRALRRPVAKVCGNRTARDVAAARGADLIGVIVGTASQRDVPVRQAKALLALARGQGSAAVAVTRDQGLEDLVDLAAILQPDFLQIHGAVPAGAVEALQGLGVGVLHGLGPGTTPAPGCDGTISDSTASGGSGRPHQRPVPSGPGLHLVAGGLEATNAASIIARSGAHGADASSALETNGRKDPTKVSAFIACVQASPRSLRRGT